MHPLIQALFSAWEWRPIVILVIVALGALYIRGWMRLRTKQSGLATPARLASYLGGLFALALSLLSPIDWLGGQLFFMHMIQHMLSIMIAAPLLWLASPFPIALWGLPRVVRLRMAGLFASRSLFRRGLAATTQAPAAWFIFIAIYLGWHEPAAYNLALRREWVHDLEHITFFAGAILFWWHVIGAAPHIHKRMPSWGRAAFSLSAIPPNMVAGVVIAFSNEVFYTYYETIPRIWGVSVLEDQRIGGAIMWIPGSMMFLIGAVLVLALGFDSKDEVTEQRPLAHPPEDSPMAAPNG